MMHRRRTVHNLRLPMLRRWRMLWRQRFMRSHRASLPKQRLMLEVMLLLYLLRLLLRLSERHRRGQQRVAAEIVWVVAAQREVLGHQSPHDGPIAVDAKFSVHFRCRHVHALGRRERCHGDQRRSMTDAACASCAVCV